MGDCDESIKLWKKMQEEGIKPSEAFKNNIVNLLRTHKIQLPNGLS